MASVLISGDTSGSITISAPAVSGTNTLTLPTATDTLVGKATTDTLTNKTLTSPVLTTPNLGTPSTLVLTNATGLAASAMPAGSVLQVVQGSYSTQVSSSSATLATTNLTASITPSSATSKVLVIVSSASSYTQAATRQISFAIFRGATNVHGSGIFGAQLYSQGADIETPHSMAFLDSPATTSSTAYALYFASTNGGAANFNQNNNRSYIILMEIAA